VFVEKNFEFPQSRQRARIVTVGAVGKNDAADNWLKKDENTAS
jgi:hypothetical protein